jgi:hypothetical protein
MAFDLYGKITNSKKSLVMRFNHCPAGFQLLLPDSDNEVRNLAVLARFRQDGRNPTVLVGIWHSTRFAGIW